MSSRLSSTFSYSHTTTNIHAASWSSSKPQVCSIIPVTISTGRSFPLFKQEEQLRSLRLCSVNCSGHTTAYESSDSQRNSKDSEGKNENQQRGSFTSNETLGRLRRYGISGVLSYGLLNTAYYLTTFLVVWFYVAPAPGRLGYLAAVERFVKVMAMVWAGSQVTKIIRAGGALALAPLVDRGLSWFTAKFNFESQAKAFMAIAGFCFGLAFLLFLVVTLLWA